MLDISIYVMAISGVTLVFDMIVYLINGEGMFPYVEEKSRFTYGITALVVIIGIAAYCLTKL